LQQMVKAKMRPNASGCCPLVSIKFFMAAGVSGIAPKTWSGVHAFARPGSGPPARRAVSRFSWQFRYREPHQKREAEFERLPVRAPDRRPAGQCQDDRGRSGTSNVLAVRRGDAPQCLRRLGGCKKGRPRGTALFAAMLFILRAKEKCRMD